MDEFGLQFLQPRFGLLALGEVANEAGEKTLLAAPASRRPRVPSETSMPSLPLADHDAADADDPPLPGAQITAEIAVMTLRDTAAASAY